jgi:prepilin-type N-terminal cleavage/methylation domain-containing protein
VFIVFSFFSGRTYADTTKRSRGRGMPSDHRRGFTLVELMLVMAIMGILAMVAMPNFVHLREKAEEASMISVGKDLQTTMEIYDKFHGRYTADLDALSAYNKNITEDPDLTFVFGTCNASGYTFTVEHVRIDSKIEYRD